MTFLQDRSVHVGFLHHGSLHIVSLHSGCAQCWIVQFIAFALFGSMWELFNVEELHIKGISLPQEGWSVLLSMLGLFNVGGVHMGLFSVGEFYMGQLNIRWMYVRTVQC